MMIFFEYAIIAQWTVIAQLGHLGSTMGTIPRLQACTIVVGRGKTAQRQQSFILTSQNAIQTVVLGSDVEHDAIDCSFGNNKTAQCRNSRKSIRTACENEQQICQSKPIAATCAVLYKVALEFIQPIHFTIDEQKSFQQFFTFFKIHFHLKEKC
ncbi:hypothetical protein Tsp_04236 [Trichinella spiralis]|uniref:hypothetical protein n=1 Tax=Trichinella spiralis TaxID=6334 RepID=UPI0001EFBF04|nr:hypothetical protein Tsp_04236 [Trichinella spiralis]